MSSRLGFAEQFEVPSFLGEDRALDKRALAPTIAQALSLAATKHIENVPTAGRWSNIPLSPLALNRICDIIRRELDRAEQDHLEKAMPYDGSRPPSPDSHFRFERRFSTSRIERAITELRFYPNQWRGLWHTGLLALPVSNQTKAMIHIQIALLDRDRSRKIARYNRALELATDTNTKASLIGTLSELGDSDAKMQIPLLAELAITPRSLMEAEFLAAKYGGFDTATRIAKLERALELATSEAQKSVILAYRAFIKDDIAACKDAAKRALAFDITPSIKVALEQLLAEFDEDVNGQAQAQAHSVAHAGEPPNKRQRTDQPPKPIKTESLHIDTPQPVETKPQPAEKKTRPIKAEPT